MPSKIKSKLLLITVFCATLAVLFIIAPSTAEIYSVILLGISLILSVLAWANARGVVELQYKLSSFITLGVLIFCTIFCCVMSFSVAGMHYIIVALCALIAVRCMSMLFAETK